MHSFRSNGASQVSLHADSVLRGSVLLDDTALRRRKRLPSKGCSDISKEPQYNAKFGVENEGTISLANQVCMSDNASSAKSIGAGNLSSSEKVEASSNSVPPPAASTGPSSWKPPLPEAAASSYT